MPRTRSAPRRVAAAVARATGVGVEWRRLRSAVADAHGEARAARTEAEQARRRLDEVLHELRALRADVAGGHRDLLAGVDAAVAAASSSTTAATTATGEALAARIAGLETRVASRVATHQVAPALTRAVRATEVGAWSLLALRDLLPGATALPPPGGAAGWAATPETVLLLVREVLRRAEHPVVVELGSGTSTAWVAAALRERGGGRVVSVEHGEEYAAATRRTLRAAGLEERATVLVGALERPGPVDPGGPAGAVVDGHTTPWYPASVVAQLPDAVDVLFVDGPPGGTGPAARRPAVPVLGGRLTPGAAVVLDDTDRAEERDVVEGWLRDLPGLRVESTTDRATLMRLDPA